MGRDRKEAFQIALLILCTVAHAVCAIWVIADL